MAPGVAGPFRRNATLVAIAGTATLSLLVGTSGDIEPVFAYVSRHRVMDPQLPVLDPLVAFLCPQQGLDSARAQRELLRGAALDDIAGKTVPRRVATAHAVAGADHVRVQAAFQRHIDGGITKTVNCATSTSITDVKDWLRLAH